MNFSRVEDEKQGMAVLGATPPQTQSAEGLDVSKTQSDGIRDVFFFKNNRLKFFSHSTEIGIHH